MSISEDGAAYMVLSTEDMAALEEVVDRMIMAHDPNTFTYQTQNGGTVTITAPKKEEQ